MRSHSDCSHHPTKLKRTLTRSLKTRYPLTLHDLTTPELTQLTRIVLLDNPATYQIGQRPNFPEMVNNGIKGVIRNQLPTALRTHRIFGIMPKDRQGMFGRTARLCGSHKEINGYVVANTLDLLKEEVIRKVEVLHRFITAAGIDDFERKLLRQIQGIRRLWGADVPLDSTMSLCGGVTRAPSVQANGCEACMLARVVRDAGHLRNLRVALLSRGNKHVRGRNGEKKIQEPRLLRFVDTAIDEGHAACAVQMFAESQQMAEDFKGARKVAEKARRRASPGFRHSQERERERGRRLLHREPSNETINVYLDRALQLEYLEQQQLGHAEWEVSHALKENGRTATYDTLADGVLPYYESVPHLPNGEPHRANETTRTLVSNELFDYQKVDQRRPVDRMATGMNKMQLGDDEHEIIREHGYDAGALAAEYRAMVSSEYTASVYSRSESAIKKPSPDGTTWSLVLNEEHRQK